MDHRAKCESITLAEKNHKRKYLWPHVRQIPLRLTPKVRSRKEEFDKLDFKIKNICSLKDMIDGIKIQVTDCDKTFAYHIFDKELILRIYILKTHNSTMRK